MNYPHWIRITRPSEAGGTQDVATGRFTSRRPEHDVIYDGWADVQDKGREISRTEEGLVVTGDGVAFPAAESVARRVEEGDTVVVTWNPGAEEEERDDAQVAAVRRLDASIDLRWL